MLRRATIASVIEARIAIEAEAAALAATRRTVGGPAGTPAHAGRARSVSGSVGGRRTWTPIWRSTGR